MKTPTADKRLARDVRIALAAAEAKARETLLVEDMIRVAVLSEDLSQLRKRLQGRS